MPEQTIEDVWNAEALFVEEVARRHPGAIGKPVVIANCQAGWQTMIMAATNPDIAGPLLIAGAPLSYWAGVRGKNPMRYLGGLLGGSWMTAMAGDLGAGKFDGANLVANFESMDLANTYWNKPHNVYSKVDTEAERFLDFETWWGSPVLLNAQEMEWISGNLFVGNKLTRGNLRTAGGEQIDLRNIRSPIIVFCSWGDNITPPQQALGWITDIYRDDRDLVAAGQTIVYSLHQSIGHLGIFVSGSIASKEHGEFVSCMDMIDLMPPGLYEAVITEVDEDTVNPELVPGKYLFALEPRKLDDIRALGENSPADELAFATAARVSEVNKRLYESFARPFVRSLASETTANAARSMHANRMRFSAFSSKNPAMQTVEDAARSARENRVELPADNPFLAAENSLSSLISSSLSAIGKARDTWAEQAFFLTYGSPLLQALAGVNEETAARERHIEREATRDAALQARRSALEQRFDKGGLVEATLRAIAYIRLGEDGVDERGFAALRKLHDARPAGWPGTLAELQNVLDEQSLLVRMDEKRALSTLPKLLPRDTTERGKAFRAVRRIVSTQGALSDERQKRLARIERLFVPTGRKNPSGRKTPSRKATDVPV